MRLGLGLFLGNLNGGGTTIGPSATPTNVFMGVPTDTSITVVHRLANDTQGARLVASTADDFSASPIYSARADSSSATVTHTLTGLSANTTYYLGLETNGAITPYSSGNTNLYTAGKTWTGTFTTAPVAPGTAASFRWGFGSCQSSVTAGAVLTGIRNNHPVKFFIHLGDLHYKWSYPVYPDPDLTVFEQSTDNVLQALHSGKFIQRVPLAYMADDHDGLGNNGTAVSHTPQSVTYPLPTGMIASFKNYFARRSPVTLPIANSNGNLSHSFPYGRFRFIMLDSRTQKRWDIAGGTATVVSAVTASTTIQLTATWSGGNQNAPPLPGMELWIAGSPTHVKIVTVSPTPVNGDNGLASGVSPPFTLTLDGPVTANAGDSVHATTQMLGPTQMTWLLAELDAAAAAGQFVVICFPNGWEHTGWQDDWIYTYTVGDDAGTGQRSMVGEHRAISDKILSAGLNGKVVVIGGDNHCTQIDKGSNMDFSTGGGLILPSIRVCPLNANSRALTTSTDFDHYNECQTTAAAGSLTALKTDTACYVDATDAGGASVTLSINPMMSSNNPTASDYTAIPSAALSLTLPISPPQPFQSAGVTVVQHARFHPPASTTNGWRSYFLNPVTQNNLLIAYFVSNSASMGSGFSVPAGWTLVGTSGSANVFDRVYWKFAGAGESQTPTFGNTPNSAIMHMHVVELFSATGWQANPIDATTVDPGSSTLRNTTSVSHTTGANNLPVLAMFAQDGSAMHSDKSGFGWQGGLTQIIKSPLPERPQVILGGTVQATAGAATYGYNAPDSVPASTPSSWTAYSNRMMCRTISLKPN